MILNSIQPINWGPFDTSAKLVVEPDVTIITGANDAGKSSLLRLLDAMYRFPGMVQGGIREYDLNLDYRDSSKTVSWDKQTEFGCRATFTSTADLRRYLTALPPNYGIGPGEEISIIFNLAPGARSSIIYRGSQPIASNGALTKMPHIIGLPTGYQVNDIVNMAEPNHAELRLLQVAFGGEFSAERLRDYSPPVYNRAIAQAKQRLKEAVGKVLPSSLNLTIDVQPSGTTQQELAIQPIDLEFGYSPLGSRGMGVRTLLTLVCGLLEADVITEQLVIYLDEPETSLHADSQHRLRALLEELGRRPLVQILYATHSSSMINNMRPHNVRLLKRILKNERVVTEIIDRPVDSSFVAIRSSLGMSPADSLLYAPISIIVEGVTESICLPLMLRRLHEFGVHGFEELSKIVPQCHILDGEGEGYLHQVALAKSQGSSPIVFLDGDKTATRVKAKHPEVQVVLLDKGQELEELVSRDLYFQALKASLEETEGFNAPEGITPTAFVGWESQASDKAKALAYTKRIGQWLYEKTEGQRYDKPKVMKKAIDLVTNASQINHTKLLELIAGIKQLLPPQS